MATILAHIRVHPGRASEIPERYHRRFAAQVQSWWEALRSP